MKVRVETLPNTDGAALAGILQTRIKDIIGVTASIEVGDPGSVPRSEGKAVRVVDNR
jgi:phenylacetate-CoA ligase